MAKGRKPKPVTMTLSKEEMNAILFTLKLSIDSSQADPNDFIKPNDYETISIQMALFVRIAERYKARFCKENS